MVRELGFGPRFLESKASVLPVALFPNSTVFASMEVRCPCDTEVVLNASPSYKNGALDRGRTCTGINPTRLSFSRVYQLRHKCIGREDGIRTHMPEGRRF